MIMHIKLLLYFINSSESWDVGKDKDFKQISLYYQINMMKDGSMEEVLAHWSYSTGKI